jgi:hypothetical protein
VRSSQWLDEAWELFKRHWLANVLFSMLVFVRTQLFRHVEISA